MKCEHCGQVESTAYRADVRAYLCVWCNADTPAKVTRSDFDRLYWGDDVATVPQITRAMFWDDYLASMYGSVEAYRLATSQPVL